MEVVWKKFKRKFQGAIHKCIAKRDFMSQNKTRNRTNTELLRNKRLWAKTKKI